MRSPRRSMPRARTRAGRPVPPADGTGALCTAQGLRALALLPRPWRDDLWRRPPPASPGRLYTSTTRRHDLPHCAFRHVWMQVSGPGGAEWRMGAFNNEATRNQDCSRRGAIQVCPNITSYSLSWQRGQKWCGREIVWAREREVIAGALQALAAPVASATRTRRAPCGGLSVQRAA